MSVSHFEWLKRSFGQTETRSFSITIASELDRPIENLLVAISFLDPQKALVHTEYVAIKEILAANSAIRTEGTVDNSVYLLNRLPDLSYDILREMTRDRKGIFKGRGRQKGTFELGGTSIQVTWSGNPTKGYEPSFRIDGKESTKREYEQLYEEEAGKLRQSQILTFDYLK